MCKIENESFVSILGRAHKQLNTIRLTESLNGF